MGGVTAGDDDKLAGVVAVSIFAVRSRKWRQSGCMDKEFRQKSHAS